MKPAERRVAVIGGGPAGLMAAETLARAGEPVHVYDAMPSVGRKFLLAGIGGMNITHSEPFADFIDRYRTSDDPHALRLRPLLEAFTPDDVRAWIHALGIETFVGTSGRVFPREMKAAPLLRAWLHRLRGSGVKLHTRHRWLGWNDDGALRFATPEGQVAHAADAVVLALGGASWPKLGSDAAWLPLLQWRGVRIAPLAPTNCGFEVEWSEHLRTRHAGAPVKAVAMHFDDGTAHLSRRGEFIVTAAGIEGTLVYALSAPLREAIRRHGAATVHLDLAPDHDQAALAAQLARPRGKRSFAEHLRRQAGLHGVKAALLHEVLAQAERNDAAIVAARIKRLPVTLRRARPIEEAISTAGGVAFDALDERLMLRALPGVFCAGEMLDWEAPTGGYLLTACLASGRAAGEGARAWLDREGASTGNP